MPIDPQDGGLDDWFVPARPPSGADGPDDWFVPAPAASPNAGAPAPNAQPSLGNPGRSNPPATRPDPLADYWSLIPASRAGAMAWQPPIFLPPNPFSHENIPASKWVTPPPIFLNSPGQSPSPPAAPPSLPSIPIGGLLGALANLPATNSAAGGYDRLGAIARLRSANPAAFQSLQWPASSDGDQFAQSSFPQALTKLAWSPQSFALGADGNADDGTDAEQAPEPISCQGPTCTMGGSYGTSGMYSVYGRNLCRNCAVKILGIENLPAAEQTSILQNFLRR
jgi:hypothetical protein